MPIDNALAGVAVKDLDAAVPWYERLLGPGRRPMTGLCEWTLPRGGCLQVFVDRERAGRSSVTFAVTDMERQLAELAASEIAIVRADRSAAVHIAIVADPDGNQVVFARAFSDALAR